MPQDTYDVVVIGGGPAGENAAAYAIAGSQRTAAIVERELVGGECSYWACIPSKALLRPTQVLEGGRALPGVSERITAGGLQLDAVFARRDAFVSHHNDAGQVKWADSNGIDVVRGVGQLAGRGAVNVGGRTLRARHAVVVATGTTARLPDVPGLPAALPWTSRDATNMHEVPQRVVIVGGGVVACESATWMAAFGAEVTMLVRGSSLVSGAEPFARERIVAGLRAHGVDVRFRTAPVSVHRERPENTGEGRIHGGPVLVQLDDGSLQADEIVVAAGRVPATADLGLGTVGLEADKPIPVDDHLCVTNAGGEWLYAVGDVNGRTAVTHMGKYQARVCGDVIAARAEGRPLSGPRYTARADRGLVPQVVFTAPELGSAGITEAQARERGLSVRTTEIDIAVAGASLSRDDFSGRAKLVIDADRQCLLGATFVGPDVGELVHAATIAIAGEVPLETLWHAVPAFPTVSEIWLRLLESLR
ncbi:NAD(P)/FAD-dependent oxidoreductase [Hoyosella sp. YIM 151337]|uniref:dihydrolipoyl dehydrogenase family protein n=1 Tax=Hoyosella sp. YIM 151337 TaxID=2992742 RepID=UPI0022355BDD|nr:NAD(P)/FAD-dependent oxidoreductase [Hoyosella sp. YIM 151337]MCW4351732.1 NAD(P)/FAD-dependent oxidoreductase [Hoyosella sp. YIM 151337]